MTECDQWWLKINWTKCSHFVRTFRNRSALLRTVGYDWIWRKCTVWYCCRCICRQRYPIGGTYLMETTAATYIINEHWWGHCYFYKTMPTTPKTFKGVKAQNAKLSKWVEQQYPNFTEYEITPANELHLKVTPRSCQCLIEQQGKMHIVSSDPHCWGLSRGWLRLKILNWQNASSMMLKYWLHSYCRSRVWMNQLKSSTDMQQEMVWWTTCWDPNWYWQKYWVIQTCWN